MRTFLILVIVISLSITLSLNAQQQNTIMPASSAEKFNERGFPETGFESSGNEIINDYDGNLMIDYSTKLEFFGGELTTVSMIYNANVQHRFFINENDDAPGYNVNVPEWILGVNGIAIQILNFETNFFAKKENGFWAGLDMRGSDVPLIIPGYHYSNLITNDGRYDGENSSYFGYDYIRILKSDGSQICLRNTNVQNNTGTYKEEGIGNNGYAIVKYISGSNIFRKMWYKPGDGLTYYFEEEYSNLVGKMTGGPNDPKIMYLLKIISPLQDTVYFNYSNEIHQDVAHIQNGRKVLKNICINTVDPYYLDKRELLEVYYNIIEFSGTEYFAGLRLINWNDVILNYYCNLNGQTDIIGTVRDPNGSRRAYVSMIKDDSFKRDDILYQSQERKYTYNYQAGTTISYTSYLPSKIEYQSGKTSEFPFYGETYTIPIGNNTIELNSPDHYINSNMIDAFRDCFTNFMVSSRKLKKGTQLVKTESYTYVYEGQSGNITNLMKYNPEIYGIKTKITETYHVTNGSSPTQALNTTNYSTYKTGYMDNIFGDFFKTTKLISKQVEDTSPGQSGNKVVYTYDYDLGSFVDNPGDFYDHYNGKFHMNDETNQKFKDGIAFKSLTTNHIYTYEPGTNILKSEQVEDPVSLKNLKTYFNYIPVDLSYEENFYKIGLVDENKIYSVNAIKSYYRNIYYPETNIPQINPNGIFRGKLRYTEQLSSINGRETLQEYKYYTLDEDTTYKGYLKSITYDNGNTQIFTYPNLRIAWTPLDTYEVLPEEVTGQIAYWDGSVKDSVFYKNYHQYKPFKTTTILNDGEDTLSYYSSFDKRGNLLFEIDANGKYSEYKYDKLNRLIEANLAGSFVETDPGVIYQREVSVNDTLVKDHRMGSYVTKYSNGEILTRLTVTGASNAQIIGNEEDAPAEVIEEDSKEDGDVTDELYDSTHVSSVCYIFFGDELNMNNVESISSVSFLLHSTSCSLPDPSTSREIFVKGVSSDSTLFGNPVSFIFEQNYLYSENEVEILSILNEFKSAGKSLIGFQFSTANPGTGVKEFNFRWGQANETHPFFAVKYRTVITDTLFASGTAFYNYDDDLNKIESIRRFSNNPSALNKTLSEKAEYDEFGLLNNLLRKNQAGNYHNTKENLFNSMNLVYKSEDGENRPYYSKYDYLGRTIEKRYDPDFGETNRKRYYYLPYSLPGELYEEQEYFDEENKHTEKFYDKVGNLIKSKQYDGTTTFQTQFNYNDIYELESVVSPGGKTTSYLYDDLGNISQKTSPDGGITRFMYDKYGNLRFELNNATPPGEKGLIFCKYDKVGRLVIKGALISTYGFDLLDADLDYSVDQSGLGPFENYLTNIDKFLVVNMYDKYERTGVFSNLNGVSSFYLKKKNLNGRLVATAFRDRLTDPWSFKVYGYDALGRVTDMWVYDRKNYNPRRIINEYDNFGNIVKQNVNYQMYYWYEYNTEGQLNFVWSNHTDSKTTANLEATYYYDGSGLETTQYSNLGKGHTFLNYSVYDDLGRTQIKGGQIEDSQYPDSWLTIFNQNLIYFNNSNIKSELIENTADQSWEDLAFYYTYDGLNRIKMRVWPGHPAEQYEYDLDGNLTSKNRTGKNISYSMVSGSNKLASVTVNSSNYNFSYDYKGNLTFDGFKNINLLDYDHRNLPLQMTKSSDIYKFGYDDNGQRIYKWSANSAEYYLRDHTGRELLVYDLYTNRVKMANLFGNGLLGRVDVTWDSTWVQDGEGFWYWAYSRTDDRYYYVRDHLGSIRMTLDENSEIVAAQDYYPFGEIMRGLPPAGTNDKYKFTGKERDEGTTNYDYFGARYYDSELARWQSVDPLDARHPEWSPYVYCLNNPLSYTDPDGSTEEEREKAIQASNDLLGTPYKEMDCSHYVAKSIEEGTGFEDLRKGGEGADGATNGVAMIVGNSREVDISEMREGDLVTFRTNRSEHKGPNGKYDHIGIVTGEIQRNESGDVVAFTFNHSSSSKNEAITSNWTGNSKWRTLTGVYQWDTQREVIYNAQLPDIVVVGKSVATQMRESFSKSIFERE